MYPIAWTISFRYFAFINEHVQYLYLTGIERFSKLGKVLVAAGSRRYAAHRLLIYPYPPTGTRLYYSRIRDYFTSGLLLPISARPTTRFQVGHARSTIGSRVGSISVLRLVPSKWPKIG